MTRLSMQGKTKRQIHTDKSCILTTQETNGDISQKNMDKRRRLCNSGLERNKSGCFFQRHSVYKRIFISRR